MSTDSVAIPSANQEDVASLNLETSPAIEEEHLFGDYELGPEIARGGMGVVYRARQISLNRAVALKMIARGEFASAMLVERFQIEASAAARLDHPHIVPIYEIGEFRGQVYYSMKLMEGGNLAEQIANSISPFSNEEGARLLIKIAEAIHYAHQHGVLHRDLKPSNILLDASGPRVADFGLAKVIEDESGLTLSTATLGTPAYMAPEQAAGRAKEVTTAADIYSLGAILYEILTRHPPFQAESPLAMMRQVIEQEPPLPRSLNRAVAADLETICLKCLEKEPGKRYDTAQELADDLARFLRDEPIHARPVTRAEHAWRWCRRKPALAGAFGTAALLLLALAVGSPIAIYRINRALKAEQLQLKRAEEESLKARRFAYASDMNLAQQAVQGDDLYRALQLLESHRPAPNQLGSSRREEALTRKSALRTPDSGLDLRGWEWRYLWRQCQGEELFILGKYTNYALAVGLLADGKTVFSAGDNSVCLWDLEGRRRIGQLLHPETVIGAAASRDGRWLATASEKDWEGQPVVLWNPATQKIAATLTTDFWLTAGSIIFSPDSKWLAFATMIRGLRIWDVRDVNALREVTNLPAFCPPESGLAVAFSPDSRTLAYNENDQGAILLWDTVSRSVVHRLSGHQNSVVALAFSPDGQTLASGSYDRTISLWNVAERRQRLQFTNHVVGSPSFAFSPDGRTLAMAGADDPGQVIRLVEVETGIERAILRGHLQNISGLAFTPDGRSLLSASLDGTIRVWDPVPQAKETSLHEFARNSISTDWVGHQPALCLSPDGRHLLTAYTNQTFSLWDTLRLAEGERHALPFTNTTIAAVAPGGRQAAFGSQSGEVMWWDVDKAQARLFARPGTNRISLLVFSQDGRYLAASEGPMTLSQMALAKPQGTVHVWDVSAQETHVLSGEMPALLRFSADANALVIGIFNGSVKLWQLDPPNEAATLPGHSGWVGAVALLPGGQTLISAESDIHFWDVRSGRETDKLSPRADLFRCIALSPDGRRFAAGAGDGLIRLWDLASHREVATLEGHKDQVLQLTFTPDGDHLVSASKDQLRVWHAPSWAAIEATEKRARK